MTVKTKVPPITRMFEQSSVASRDAFAPRMPIFALEV